MLDVVKMGKHCWTKHLCRFSMEGTVIAVGGAGIFPYVVVYYSIWKLVLSVFLYPFLCYVAVKLIFPFNCQNYNSRS